MGFRTSFYRCKIEDINHLIGTEIDDNIIDDNSIQRNCLMYDAFTNSVMDVCNDEQYMSKIFSNEYDDYLYRYMNKDQFGNFIKYVLKNYVEYRNKHVISFSDFNKLKDELKDGYDDSNMSRYSLDYDNLKVIDKLIFNQYDYNLLINLYTGDYSYIDDILSDPWKVSMSWSTEMAIVNLIHIYHMMDWEKELIMIEGWSYLIMNQWNMTC